MRFVSLLTAFLVIVGLYLLLFERDRVLEFAGATPPPDATDQPTTQSAPADDTATPATDGPVSVVALNSTARKIDSAVVLHGRTEAARQVVVKSEAAGQVISEPLPKGSRVAAGQVLCRLDPGTSEAALREARARLTEALARIPEAQARVTEAQARIPAARAALTQAEAQVAAAEAALADARARIPAAQARVDEARARLSEAELNYNAAIRLKEGGFASDTRVANAEAGLKSARAAVESALSQLQGTRAGVQSAEAQLAGARAAVQSAQSQIESATAGVQSAESGVQNARAGVQAAEARVASAEQAIENLTITAPFAGLLQADTAELGSLLQPGAPCATIVQMDPIRLVGFVPEARIDRVREGITAGGRLNDGRELVGTVTYVARVSDPMTRTFRVDIEVANPDVAVLDGLTVEMAIPTEGRMAHLLPQSALTLDDDGVLGVRVVEPASDGPPVARFLPVELIRDTRQGVWVAGLPDQVAVIVVGQDYVTDGVPLDPAYREPET